MTSQTETDDLDSEKECSHRDAWPSSCIRSFGSRYFLYTLSIVIFFTIWDLAAVKKVFGKFSSSPDGCLGPNYVAEYRAARQQNFVRTSVG